MPPGPKNHRFDPSWTKHVLESFRLNIAETETHNQFLTVVDHESRQYLVAVTKTDNHYQSYTFRILLPGTTEEDFFIWMSTVPPELLHHHEREQWMEDHQPDLQAIGGVDLFPLTEGAFSGTQWKHTQVGWYVSASAIQHGWRGRGLMTSLYKTIACEMFPLYSDSHVTTGARRVWNSLKNTYGVKVETRNNRFYMECKNA